jgi:predicted nucleic acid-binding protein
MSAILPDEMTPKPCFGGYSVYVPTIFYLECGNVLRYALKRNRISRSNFDEYIDVVMSFPLTVDHHSSSRDDLHSIMNLVHDFDLSTYDASYLELCIRLNAKLASQDKELIDASRQNNIDVVLSSVVPA